MIVGNGRPPFIEGFREKAGYEGPIYTDPGRRAYEALGLVRGLRATLHPKTILRAISALREGHRQTGTRGDPWQQGGVFVIGTGGEMIFSYASEYAGDHPPIARVLRALRDAAG